MTNRFQGQWTGTSTGGSYCVANIDQSDIELTARVSLFESVMFGGVKFPYWTWSDLHATVIDENSIAGTLAAPTIHERYGRLFSDSDLAKLKESSGLEFPISTSLRGKSIGPYELLVEWTSHYPSGKIRRDSVSLKRQRLGSSRISHVPMSWGEYKKYSLNQDAGLIYRGQARHWSLRTSYHRTGHADLVTYLDQKIPEVENHINSISKHVYDINNDRSLGALLNLVQHHGYPTPLLDWTKSPYVAAFFAYENEAKIKKGGNVSIFAFNDQKWARMAGRRAELRTPSLTIRTMELPTYGNPRVLPQQAVTMYSNVDDLEAIIRSNEKPGQEYLGAVSVPASERDVAMRDLSLMGITWGSLFPDLDGICRQLASRHF